MLRRFLGTFPVTAVLICLMAGRFVLAMALFNPDPNACPPVFRATELRNQTPECQAAIREAHEDPRPATVFALIVLLPITLLVDGGAAWRRRRRARLAAGLGLRPQQMPQRSSGDVSAP